MSRKKLLNRVIRLKNAPAYLGMDKNRFNTEVRPMVTVIPIGKQGIGFDRGELDDWLKDYKNCHGIPATINGRRVKPWDALSAPAYVKEEKFGISKNSFLEFAFEKALILSTQRRPNVISRDKSKC